MFSEVLLGTAILKYDNYLFTSAKHE